MKKEPLGASAIKQVRQLYSPTASDMHFVRDMSFGRDMRYARDMHFARDMSFGRDMRYAHQKKEGQHLANLPH